MTRSIVFVLVAASALAVAAPASGQEPAPAEPVRVIRTPAPVEDPAACAASVDCTPDLAGGQSRAARTWSVRSSHVPADIEPQPYYPIAIIADVDAEEPRRHDRDSHDRDGRGPRR